MCITWNDSGGAGDQVEYGTSGALGSTAKAESFAAPGSLGSIYEAELTGLKPGTEYTYRVGGGGAWSEQYTFRTAMADTDPCTPFSFVVLGDGRSQDEAGAAPQWHTIMAEALDHGPSLILNTGDLVKSGDVVGQWKDYLEKTDPAQAFVPHFPSIGNHDDDKVEGEGALYNMVHQLPRNDETDTEDFYYVTVGDAIFVSLTTVNFKDDNFGLQAGWLDKVLTENPKRWKFVFFHHPPYASTDLFGLIHPPNEEGQNAAFVPIFDKHHVDVVFNGHNHFYERFKPLKGGGGGDQGKENPDGTVYVITGGAGAITFDIAGDFFDIMALICGTATGSTVCDGRHHFVKVDIDGNKASFSAIATSAQNFDTNVANIETFDTFEIVKSDPLNCEEPGTDTGDDTTDTGDDTTDTGTGDTTGSGTGDTTGGDTTGGDTTGGDTTGGDTTGDTGDTGADAPGTDATTGDDTGAAEPTTDTTGDSGAATGLPAVDDPGSSGSKNEGGRETSGCSAAATPPGSSGAGLLLLVLAALWLQRRRLLPLSR